MLAERFNNDFNGVLTEEEKLKLSEILTMSSEDLSDKFTMLKEDIEDKLSDMMLSENDLTVKNKLDTAIREAKKMPVTKYNYYKLQQLRNGL